MPRRLIALKRTILEMRLLFAALSFEGERMRHAEALRTIADRKARLEQSLRDLDSAPGA